MFLKRKIAELLIILGISLATFIPMASAVEVKFSAYTDRAFYRFGEEGTLYVTVRNDQTGPIAVKKIDVRFPWWGWYHEEWSGNITMNIREEEQTVIENRSRTYSIKFTVPSESRDQWKKNVAEIRVTYVYGDETITSDPIDVPINIALPVYNENIIPIYYLAGILTIAVIVVIVELYLVWRRLGKLTAPSTPS
jgi:hypothetical protein